MVLCNDLDLEEIEAGPDLHEFLIQVVEVKHHLLELLQLGSVRKLALNQFLLKGIDVVVELLDLTLETVPNGKEVIKLTEEVGANLKQPLQRLRIQLNLLVVLLDREVHEHLLLPHLVEVVVNNADLPIEVREQILSHLLLTLNVVLVC